ncbi:MAG: hypothetical protein RJA26_1191 [Actinomycetota bacterium]|jgi:virulence-associated protein VagC
MEKVYVTKVFQNGGSQAVRIPAELRFEDPEVFIWWDEEASCLRVASSPPSNFKKFREIQKVLLPLVTQRDLEIIGTREQLPMELPRFLQDGESQHEDA